MAEKELTKVEVLTNEVGDARAKLSELTEALNESESLTESKALLNEIDTLLKTHNEKSKELYIEDALTKGNSFEIMRHVCLSPTYKICAVPLDKESGTYSVKESAQFINAEVVHKRAKGGIGVDKNWIFYAHKLNYLICVRVAHEVMGDEEKKKQIAASYEMKDAVRSVLFPDNVDPLKDIDEKKDLISNKNITVALRYVVSAMIGKDFGDKMISRHSRYLANAYATHDRKEIGGGLKLVNDKQFTRLLMDICYRLLTNTDYEIKVPNIKK